MLARYDDDEMAAELQLGPGESRGHSILPRDDIQGLMGDDYLSLASIKALRTIDESQLLPKRHNHRVPAGTSTFQGTIRFLAMDAKPRVCG